jgi:hypothetical protein
LKWRPRRSNAKPNHHRATLIQPIPESLFSISKSKAGGVQSRQQCEGAFGCLTGKRVNDWLHHRIMKKTVTQIITLLVLALSLVLLGAGCGPL